MHSVMIGEQGPHPTSTDVTTLPEEGEITYKVQNVADGVRRITNMLL